MRKAHIKIIFGVLGTVLIAIAGFRLLGLDSDYYNYRDRVVDKENMDSGTEELALTVLVWVNDFLFYSNMHTFLLMFAMLGVSIKLLAILKYSKNAILSLLLYFFSYFILHEYTQIRAGVATGIFMLSISDIASSNPKKYFTKAILAMMFHWSSAVLFPLYFIIKNIKTKFFYVFPFIGIIFFLTGYRISEIILDKLSTIMSNSDYFNTHHGHQEQINVFNIINTSHLLIFVLVSYLNFKKIKKIEKFDLVLFKIFSISLFIFYFLASFQLPVIAFRLYEYLNVVLLLLIPSIVDKFKHKLFPAMAFIMYYMVYTYHLIVNTQALPDVLIFFKSI